MNTPPLNKKPEFVELVKSVIDDIAVQTADDITAVREALEPTLKEVFDAMPTQRKMIAAALYRRRYEELILLSGSSCRFLGLHDFGNTLNFVLNGVPAFYQKAGSQK